MSQAKFPVSKRPRPSSVPQPHAGTPDLNVKLVSGAGTVEARWTIQGRSAANGLDNLPKPLPWVMSSDTTKAMGLLPNGSGSEKMAAAPSCACATETTTCACIVGAEEPAATELGPPAIGPRWRKMADWVGGCSPTAPPGAGVPARERDAPLVRRQRAEPPRSCLLSNRQHQLRHRPQAQRAESRDGYCCRPWPQCSTLFLTTLRGTG